MLSNRMTSRFKVAKISAAAALYLVIIQARLVLSVFNASQEINPLDCYDEGSRTEFDRACHPVEVYSPLEWSRMPPNEANELARNCSCQLLNFDWDATFDDHPSTRRVFMMVKGVLQMDKYKDQYPPQLWNDIEVVVNGYSIYLSTNAYFRRRKLDPSVGFFKEIEFEKQAHLRDLRYFCLKVARDELDYYQYLENLARINPVMFFSVLRMNDMVNMVYQASKACKLFILYRVNEFKKKPHNNFYAVEQAGVKPSDVSDFNQLQSNNNIDLTLKDLSLKLYNCKHWHYRAITLELLERECSIMMGETLPSGWLDNHSEPGERSMLALQCGCQLLALNSSWAEIIADKDLSIMSKALTSYMNQNQLPVMNDRETSTWEYFAWFDRVMQRFIKSRKMSVKEIVKYKRGNDPAHEINRQTGDEEQALSSLRLGCNRLMFNHIKGSDKVDAVRPIRYLDNLRYISQDPLFVFHLTLLDANLFKLHALSKMCEPVVH